MLVKIAIDKETKESIFVPADMEIFKSFKERETIEIHAGLLKSYAIIRNNNSPRDGIITLSQDVAEALKIPCDITYQVKLVDGGLRLGPVIGLLLANSRGAMLSKKPEELLSYTAIYPQVGGLLFVFYVDGINYRYKVVKGFYYNPEAQNRKSSWEEAILPFPDAIFRRTAMDENASMRLKEITSNRIFNSRYFNKWEFWNKVARNRAASEFLPFTKLYKSIDDVDDMVKRYGCAYLKPMNGTLSRGLMRVAKENGEYKFQLKQGAEVTSLSSREAAESFISNKANGRRYLIQQAISPIKVDSRHMDLRVIMQKDQTKKWNCTGIIAFIGRPNQIVSNWGYEMVFEDMMTRHFNMSQKDIFKKRQEIVNACKLCCNALDSTGENFGDLGFDVILDEKMKVWVLEANKKHYHTVPLWINDEQMYYSLKANIIKYASALAGF